MTADELKFVKKVLLNIKPREDGEPRGKVQRALALVDKDLAVREAQRDNFKNLYDYEEGPY